VQTPVIPRAHGDRVPGIAAVPLFKFRIGDVFDTDDPLAVWLRTLSMARRSVLVS